MSHSRQQLQQWFASIDQDRSGQLSVFELQRALALGGLNFSLKTVQGLMKLHDRDGSGHISFPEYEQLHGFLTSVCQAFHAFDTDRSGSAGSLDRQEVAPALARAGFRLEPPAFEALFKLFDPDRTGTLNMAEFVAMSSWIQAATATFRAFDPHNAGRITLDLSQFVYAAASCG